jgi:putative colanic acid biosynthesis acetyltransferase WcaF
MDEYSCLGPFVDCYNVARVTLGAHATVSQYCFLCTASHDFEATDMPLVSSPIVVGDGAWIAADAFIAPGVAIGEGAVVGARSTVLRDVQSWTVVAGNPARFIKARVMKNA